MAIAFNTVLAHTYLINLMAPFLEIKRSALTSSTRSML
jgi:hypothetical protein